MKLSLHLKDFFSSLRRLRASTVVAIYCSCLFWIALSAENKSLQTEEEDIFQSTNLLRITIEIPEAGLQLLRTSHPNANVEGKPQGMANVTEGGKLYTNVSVQLKGFTTFRPIDFLPSLTLNFDTSAPRQKFHGLSKISLNNSLQDPSRLQEKFSREMFAAARVPVPRADHAIVTLNGRALGLYVLIEGFDKEFLKRHFKRADGTFYEGGVLQDIDRLLDARSSRATPSNTPVQKLIDAAREPDPSERWHALNEALDMDRFISMVAMETILCHSDSYSMNRNNYRLYHDPSTDKIVFMPHGMDRVLGTHRSGLDLSITPPILGLVARAVLNTPEGRHRHIERVGLLFTNLFRPDLLCDRVQQIEAKLFDARNNEVSQYYRPMLEARPDNETGNLCERICKRAANLKIQFEHLSDSRDGIPTPLFDTNGVAQIQGWGPKLGVSQPAISSKVEIREGHSVLHLRTSEGSLMTSLRAKVSLPAGNYRLLGSINATAITNRDLVVFPSILRYSSGRYAIERRPLPRREINYDFEVAEPRVPEEIELICDIRAAPPEVWFDASSLKLMRVE